jgi:hypothetical protein
MQCLLKSFLMAVFQQRAQYRTTEVIILCKVYLSMITCAQNALIHKDLSFNIFCKSMHLVYQKLNETKSILELAMQTDHFLV